jgi:hypothetical protein
MGRRVRLVGSYATQNRASVGFAWLTGRPSPRRVSGGRYATRVSLGAVVAVVGGCTVAGRCAARGAARSMGRCGQEISARSCSATWRRNLETLHGDIVLSAVTAPGADELPWDESVCVGLGEHKHSGKLGCRVDRVEARAWNESAADRWRRLHRRAYQDTVKRVGKGSVWLVARVWEMQARGVLTSDAPVVHWWLRYRFPACGPS